MVVGSKFRVADDHKQFRLRAVVLGLIILAPVAIDLVVNALFANTLIIGSLFFHPAWFFVVRTSRHLQS